MAVIASQVSVGDSTPALLYQNGGLLTVDVYIRVASDGVFVGPSGVTISTGYRPIVGESLRVRLATGESIYGISYSGNITAYVMASNVLL